MKRFVVNIMATTGITLIILALIGALYGARFLCIDSVFQSFGANIVVYLGLILTHRFESKYVILESLLDISYIIVVLFIFGFIFNWYANIPGWLLALMAVVIYLSGCSASIYRMRDDIKITNELLQNRNRQITK